MGGSWWARRSKLGKWAIVWLSLGVGLPVLGLVGLQIASLALRGVPTLFYVVVGFGTIVIVPTAIVAWCALIVLAITLLVRSTQNDDDEEDGD